ncbi:hypothetical protein DH2020_008121 [Rehmannia glutinosa]|uniref:PPM-type phosphatase domain-containing protein n=1 Tax=Rehmannia glutinosa TaxID=99300 RepID=A0ABR0U059_REHGL
MSKSGDHHTVPLSVLLKRELANEKIERPEISHGQASQSKKGEDFTFVKTECQRVLGDGVTTYSVFALFDGHNGSAAAIYSKENLLNNVLSAIPPDLNSDEWVSALPRALVAGFVKTDKDFQERAQTSGTTVTFVIIEGWILTVASVGDFVLYLNLLKGIYITFQLIIDLNAAKKSKRERITASGGEVGRLNTGGGTEIGPLRCWPGGLCLSRSIGDMDVGEFIVPVPHVKQVKLSSTGGRLIISSDGVWDALSAETAFECCRGMSTDAAASQIVKVDKEEYFEPDFVEELFEEGSASLSERLDSKYPVCNMFKLFMCAVCQVEIKPGEGISIHAGTAEPKKLRPWDGPFLCLSCQEKKEAMEGKDLLEVRTCIL